MSTRRFCDFCGNEIPTDQPHGGRVEGETTLRRSGTRDRATVKVTIAVEFHAGEPDVCADCVFTAARRIDPTPQAEDVAP